MCKCLHVHSQMFFVFFIFCGRITSIKAESSELSTAMLKSNENFKRKFNGVKKPVPLWELSFFCHSKDYNHENQFY